ncbi:MAG: M28 family peptidase, partial [Planctomycetota bacterium]
LRSLDALQQDLDAGQSKCMEFPGLSCNGQAGFQRRTTTAKNVVGLLQGTSPDGEAIVIGAHYDHLGKRKPLQRRFQHGQLVKEKVEPQIHNGADDNASGTSGLIEIAKWFTEGPKPSRSVIFVAFSAEEAGLHGSKHYTNIPTIPLSKIVAMLNMDMIGRMPKSKDQVQVFGLDSASEFDDIVRASAADHKLGILPGVDSGGRSDHAPFLRRRIPSIHFFSGHHSDYHQPSDDSEKINARDGTRVAKLVFDVARDLANRSDRPAFQESKSAAADPAAPTATFRVVMGLSPNYANDGQPGMGVDGVTSDGPADIAGMRTGDRIIRIGDKPVANIYDYMAATRGNSPGDTVDVVVLRNGKEMTLKVKLSGTR